MARLMSSSLDRKFSTIDYLFIYLLLLLLFKFLSFLESIFFEGMDRMSNRFVFI